MGAKETEIDFDDLFNKFMQEETSENAKKNKIFEATSRKTSTLSSEEEKKLEKILFGGKTELIKGLAAAVGETLDESKIEGENNKKRKPAWEDSEDEDDHNSEEVTESTAEKQFEKSDKHKAYKETLRKRYCNLISQPKWADLDREIEDDDSDEEVLRTIGHLSHSKSKSLLANEIDYKSLNKLNIGSSEGSITSIQFHPSSTAALVAGKFGVVSIYSVEGSKNEKLHSIKFKNYPIICAKLDAEGTEVLLGSNKNYYYSYDLIKGDETRIALPKVITKMKNFVISSCGKFFAISGRFGEIHLMDMKSKELIHTFKQENPCSAFQFSNDSKKIISHSVGANISIFDIRQEKCEHTFIDDGCIIGKTLSISPCGQMLATGSKEGVVNIYNYNNVLASQAPSPLKVIYNLTTCLSTMKFNHSSEILGITSGFVPNAVKLLHFPSRTVFSNFPGLNSNYGQVKVLEFSPNSGFMALGNTSKHVLLFRLKHFNNY